MRFSNTNAALEDFEKKTTYLTGLDEDMKPVWLHERHSAVPTSDALSQVDAEDAVLCQQVVNVLQR